MKLRTAIPSAAGSQTPEPRPQTLREQGFTMIEIAICLAIIGVALVGIIGVLPYGMNTQRANREETVIGQDANLLTELIRNGARGADDLTNYVYDISNSETFFDNNGVPGITDVYHYTYTASFKNGTALLPFYNLAHGTNIIGLLSTPEFLDTNGLHVVGDVSHGGYSNHVSAYIRSVSGLAAEKPPQDNQIMREDTFTYRLFIVNAPMYQDTNLFAQPYNRSLNAAYHDVRLTFQWPLLPNGNIGGGRQTFRSAVAGDLRQDPINLFFFYQPQSFTSAP